MDLKVYKNQTITLGCISNLDISQAVNVVKYIDPDGIEGAFQGTVEVEDNITALIKTRMPKVGRWRIWLFSTFPSGDELISTPYAVRVYEEGT